MSIKEGDLIRIVKTLNELTDSPVLSYTNTVAGFTPNPKNFHLSWAYGGVTLSRFLVDGGVCVDVLGCGYVRKPILYDLIRAYLAGYGLGLKEGIQPEIADILEKYI